jgi:hypothetical protein
MNSTERRVQAQEVKLQPHNCLRGRSLNIESPSGIGVVDVIRRGPSTREM